MCSNMLLTMAIPLDKGLSISLTKGAEISDENNDTVSNIEMYCDSYAESLRTMTSLISAALS